jgi:hypothetical protein
MAGLKIEPERKLIVVTGFLRTVLPVYGENRFKNAPVFTLNKERIILMHHLDVP